MKVKIDGLTDAIELELQAYSDKVRGEIRTSFTEIGTRCVKKLKETSPKRSGNYRKSWTKKVTATDSSISVSIFNKKHYSLTHLLEHGHAKRDGGRVEGILHIGPVQEWANEESMDAVVKILGGD